MSFPTTPILDNFNRADAGPPPSANWTGGLKVVSNQCKANAVFDFATWNPAQYGPDSECFVTLSTAPSSSASLGLRSDLAGNNAYYILLDALAGTLELRKIVSGSTSSLATAFSQVVSNGDSIGISAVGTTISAWYKAAAGSWTLLGTAVDSTFTGAGYLWLELDDLTGVADNFGGGTALPSYTRTFRFNLPSNDNNLDTLFSASDYTDVGSDNAVRVTQNGQDSYVLFQFKDQDGTATDNRATITWNGQSDVAPSSNTVTLEVFNRNTVTWDSIATDSSTGANTDFNLSATISLTNYKDSNGMVSCRVRQNVTISSSSSSCSSRSSSSSSRSSSSSSSSCRSSSSSSSSYSSSSSSCRSSSSSSSSSSSVSSSSSSCRSSSSSSSSSNSSSSSSCRSSSSSSSSSRSSSSSSSSRSSSSSSSSRSSSSSSSSSSCRSSSSSSCSRSSSSSSSSSTSGSGITIDATSQGSGGDGLLVSHVVGTGATLLVVSVNLRDRVNTVSAVKWGGSSGAALTRAAQQIHASSTITAEVWYLVNPTAGTNDIYVDLSANDNLSIFGSSWFGTATASVQDGSGAGSQGTSSNLTDNIDILAGSLIIDSLAHESSSASTKGASQSYINTGAVDEGTWNVGASYRIEPSAGTYGMTWTNGSSDTYAHAVAAFKKA